MKVVQGESLGRGYEEAGFVSCGDMSRARLMDEGYECASRAVVCLVPA